jgi:CBS domain-containing protein
MKTKQVMTKKVVTIKSGMTLEQAAKILTKNSISGAPVVNREGKLIGIISEKDLFKTIYPNLQDIIKHIGLWLDRQKIQHRVAKKKKIPVDQIMTKQVISVNPDAPILKAGSLMLTKRIHRIPVVEGGKIVGILARKNVFRALLKSDFDL